MQRQDGEGPWRRDGDAARGAEGRAPQAPQGHHPKPPGCGLTGGAEGHDLGCWLALLDLKASSNPQCPSCAAQEFPSPFAVGSF